VSAFDPKQKLPVVRIVDTDLTRRMTDYVILHVLMRHRRVGLYRQQQRQRVWREHHQPTAGEVTVGIMGLGVLGCEAAMALHGSSTRSSSVGAWQRAMISSQQNYLVFIRLASISYGCTFMSPRPSPISRLPATPSTVVSGVARCQPARMGQCQPDQAEARITRQKFSGWNEGALSASTSALTVPKVVSGLCRIPS
jgi:hypothetical protein